MKVLWLINKPLPQLCDLLDLKKNNEAGWIVGALNGISSSDDIEMGICFPAPKKTLVKGKVGQISFFAYPESKKLPHIYDKKIEDDLASVIKSFEPDVIHIWGTEYPQSLAMVRAFHVPSKIIISIQGLVSFYAMHYFAFLPENVVQSFTLRDLLRRDNLILQQKRFFKRGQFEKEAIKGANFLIGRTDWDYECTNQINPSAQYFTCGEILRGSFYKKKWDFDNCEKHSIFVSQSNYPIKGFHLLLLALPKILSDFPDTKVYTTSRDIFDIPFFKLSSYSKYLKKIIIDNKLRSHVVFLGPLDEESMCERYLRAHIFISPSSIENSSNSIGESMILGVPTIASDVGGVRNQITFGQDGFFYPADEPYLIPFYVKKIFSNPETAKYLSCNAVNKAEKIHDFKANTSQLEGIYREILSKG